MMKNTLGLLLGLGAIISLAGCKDVAFGDGTAANIRVVNATAGPLNLFMDGISLVQFVQPGSASALANIPPGAHTVRLSSGGLSSNTAGIATHANQTTIIAGVPSPAPGGLAVFLFSDSGSVVPAGKSKLRVVHLAQNPGNIEIWRTQPDFQTPVRIMTPFVYGAESPFLQSDPGSWEVFITASGSTTKLASTGGINIPSGERRTVVLLDSAGVKLFRVLPE